VTVRPSRSTSVSRVESAAQPAAAIEKEAKDEQEPDSRPGNTDAQDAGVNELLPPRRTGRLLPAIGEGGLLRDGPPFPGELRLPLEPLVPVASPASSGATEAAWHEFHARLRGFVRRRVRDAEAADDIVQQVFLQMHRSLTTLRSTDRVGAWLYRTARNAITDHYRTPARRREVSSGDTREIDGRHAPGSLDSPGDPAAAACAAACLRPMIDRLPPSYRRAIERVELQGLSQRSAASAEGMSFSGMKTRVQRARTRLKAMLLEHCRIGLDARKAVVVCEAGSGPRGPCATKTSSRAT
jgi:RNA polymerase sigma-70 factor (ECF subfamily)